MIKKIDIVCPVANKDTDIFIQSYKTWIKYFPWKNNIFVVYDNALSYTNKQKLQDLPYVKLIFEEALISNHLRTFHGWYRQQFYKLLAYKIVETPQYLCIDSDTIMTSTLKESDLYDSGRPIVYHWENKYGTNKKEELEKIEFSEYEKTFGIPNYNPLRTQEHYTKMVRLHQAFTQSAEFFLKTKLDYSKQYVYGAVLFDTDIVGQLITSLSNLDVTFQQLYQPTEYFGHIKLSEWTLYGHYTELYHVDKISTKSPGIVYTLCGADHPILKQTQFLDVTKYPFLTIQSYDFSYAHREYIIRNFTKDVSIKVAGVMIVKDEIDIIEEYLANISMYVDELYVLDASTDGTENILQAHALVKYYLREEDMPKEFNNMPTFRTNGGIYDGVRYFLHEQIKKQSPDTNWVILCHPDEFILSCPVGQLKHASELNCKVMRGNPLFFFPSDKLDEWDETLPVIERLKYYQSVDLNTFTWGHPFAFKFDINTNYIINKHGILWPDFGNDCKWYWSTINIGVFMYRTKEQIKKQISSRVSSEWSETWCKRKDKLLEYNNSLMQSIEPYIYLGDDVKFTPTQKYIPDNFIEFGFIKILNAGIKREDLSSLGQYRYLQPSEDFRKVLSEFKPNIIVTCNYVPSNMQNVEFNYRKRWIHIGYEDSLVSTRESILSTIETNIYKKHIYEKDHPLISVYTGAYNSMPYIKETFNSLLEQTYTNWEWVIVDDNSTDGTYDYLLSIAKLDPRIRPIRINKSGKIGEVKRLATQCCYGKYVLELDHDDFLHNEALEKCVNAFKSDESIGMVFSNDSGFKPDHTFVRWDQSSQYWKGYYREIEYKGKKWLETKVHDFYGGWGDDPYQRNAFYLTLGPDHFRAYKRDELFRLGGYNEEMQVADDWDVFVRFFLYSKAHHIDECLYFYRYRPRSENSQFVYNKNIQDLLEIGRRNYYNIFREKIKCQ